MATTSSALIAGSVQPSILNLAASLTKARIVEDQLTHGGESDPKLFDEIQHINRSIAGSCARSVDEAATQIARALELFQTGWVRGSFGRQSDQNVAAAQINDLLSSAASCLAMQMSPASREVLMSAFDVVQIPAEAR